MDTYMHGAAGMFPCKPEYLHGWVKASEARAEIVLLEKEVERLKGYGIDAVSAAYDRGSKSAWNDAIEAAAALCESKSATPVDVKEPEYYKALGYELAAEEIRDLKRPTP